MTVDRKLKKSLRANLLILGDAALRYVIEEAEREIKRRRVQSRERRKAKGAAYTVPSGSAVRFMRSSDGNTQVMVTHPDGRFEQIAMQDGDRVAIGMPSRITECTD